MISIKRDPRGYFHHLHTTCREHDSQAYFDIPRSMQFPHHRYRKDEHSDICRDVGESGPSVEEIDIEAVTADDSPVPQIRKGRTHLETCDGEGEPIGNQEDHEGPANLSIRGWSEYPQVGGQNG